MGTTAVAERPRQPLRWVVVILVAVVVLGGGAWTVWYRATYHLWPGQSVPPRLHWCGRDYDRGPGPPVSAIKARAVLGAPLNPVMHFSLPVGAAHELYAGMSASVARAHERAGMGCTTLVYLGVGADRYLIYELSGGL